MNEPTHIVFDGSKIIISPNLHCIFDFLQKIEREISGLLTVDERLNEIRVKVLEIMGLCQTMSKVIMDKGIDFEYTFKEDPALIAKNLEAPQLTRVEMITLFAYLETLICLYLAYDNETSDEKTLMFFSKEEQKTKTIINKLLLCSDNEYYAKNRIRLEKINFKQLRNLRNRLSHFFSVSGLALNPNNLVQEARNMELQSNYKVSFISPYDMNELLKYASLLMLKRWSKDCQTSKADFERKISYVKTIVERDAAVLAYKNNIDGDI